MLIRTATPADIPAITRIYAQAVAHGTASFELEPPDEVEMARRMESLLAGGFPYLAAEHDGALAGYAYAGPYRARPAYRFTVENSVYVAPQFLRRGVGKALLEALIEASTEHGFRLMIAVIGDSQQAASIGVHKAAGFSHVGVLENVGYKFGRWLDTVHMQLPLGDGARTAPKN
jgi:phosphinothricin acetyltransferase